MAIKTFYPSASAVDGGIDDNGARNTKNIATRRAEATGATAVVQANPSYTIIWQTEVSGGQVYVSRYILQFDTSSLRGCPIKSATLDLGFDTSSRQNSDSISLGVCGCTPGSATTLDVNDWDCYSALNSPTEFITRFAIGTLSDEAYVSSALNASGLAAINKTGVTSMMVRTSLDMDNTTPADNNTNNILIYTGYGSGAYRPKLVVTYIPMPVGIGEI
jgi:hypothetical protein